MHCNKGYHVNTIYFLAELCCRQCPGNEWGLCSKASCGLQAAHTHLHCRNWKVRSKADGELQKKKDLTAKLADQKPGERDRAFTGKATKWQASHASNIFPGGHSLRVPCFLQAQSEAPGVWFAEGLMSITAAGVQSEMYAGYTIKAQHSGNLG